MRTNSYSAAAIILLACTALVSAQEEIADVLADPALSLSRPDDRARIAARIMEIENRRLAAARAKGRAMGLPLRFKKPDGGTQELVDFKGEEPVYLTTFNANAAISTGANLLRPSPYALDGAGITVGVWDAAGGRPTHQEFSVAGISRLTNKNGPATDEHAMHVAGTIAASGFNVSARGMANAARIDSYDWNNDTGEMSLRAASAPGQQATKIYLSNHSYGIVSGWEGGTWWGNGTNAAGVEQDFGRYDSNARSIDALTYDAPYFLPFWAAGNDRNDNPSAGDIVRLNPSNSSTVTYNPSLHPKGDGVYRNGFETISFKGLAKNIVTIGAVEDAVTGSTRDITKATLTSFSSTGPCDDGRIKPDLVANGASVTSCVDWSNSAYTSMSGTSMASPNACGSAALLVQHYGRLFPGGAMRSSTLKGLLIHAADDLGNPGPDYKTGWGLINVKEAADLLTDHQAFPTKRRLIEDEVTSFIATRTYEFEWDGSSPIRATLCWTDPEGTAITQHDSRSSNLVNNLNLRLVAPNGISFYPFVMPFVGTWTTASMDLPATTGINNTDNVEQVLVKTPGQTGTWRAEVSYSGFLTNFGQKFGLLISGSKESSVPDIDIFPPEPNPMTWAVPPAAGGVPVPGPLAATDFTGRTVNGATASNITWQTDGLADPGDLTTDAPDGLFDTFNTQDHFAPNRNLLGEGSWSVSVPLNLTESFVTLTDVVFNYRHFTDAGAAYTAARQANWNVTVSGSTSGEIASVEIIGTRGSIGTGTAVFDPPLLLETGESYTLTITATVVSDVYFNTNPGLNTLSINGVAGIGGDPTTEITMTAVTATDEDLLGVEYYFTETSGNPGGSDSGWQDSTVYTDSGLTPGLQYSYTVTARDKSILYNTGIPSAPASATTHASAAAYDMWSEGSAFEEDDNGDGLANGLAWFLGAAHSAENSIPRLPTFDNVSDPDFFIFTHRRNDSATAAGAIGTVHYGSDLDGWTVAVHDGENVIIQVSDESPDDFVEVRIRRSLAPSGRLFARLEVVFPSP